MGAVVKLEDATVEYLCAGYEHIYPVNYNCPGQVAVAGTREELKLLADDVKQAGGRLIPLKVSGGFHSPYMTAAARRLLPSAAGRGATGATGAALF